MKDQERLKNPLLHYGLLAFIYGVGALTLLTHTVLHAQHDHAASSAPAVSTADQCAEAPAHVYTLTFTDDSLSPSTVIAQRCDKLIVANKSSDEVIAAFGPHEHHTQYPGFHETPLSPGQTYSFVLPEAGNFQIHDHDNDSLKATLVIRN